MSFEKTVVIVGPTASGKTGVAIRIAKEQDGIKHWGIDLVEPGERFTVADWKR